MKQINLAEAKAKLSRLVNDAAKGKSVIIAKSGIPMAKLVPLEDEPRKTFNFAALEGILSDEVVEELLKPLPDEVLARMLNGPITSDKKK